MLGSFEPAVWRIGRRALKQAVKAAADRRIKERRGFIEKEGAKSVGSSNGGAITTWPGQNEGARLFEDLPCSQQMETESGSRLRPCLVRALRCALAATALSAAAMAAQPPRQDTPKMPSGIWTVESKPPANAVSFCSGYLPPGTRVQIQVEGPTRRAVEEDIKNQLGVTLSLLPPLSPALCKLGIGEPFADTPRLCDGGSLAVDANQPLVFDDAVIDFRRLSVQDIASREHEFYTDLGAKRGSRFALMFLWQRAVDWDLWLQSPDRMVSECTVTLPGKNNIDSFPMVWRRQPGP